MGEGFHDLTPEKAEELLAADRGNLVKKVQGSKPLTNGERKILEKIANQKEKQKETKATYKQLPKYATSKAELIRFLDLNEASLYRWIKLPDFPKRKPRGWDVQATLSWIRLNYRNGSGGKGGGGELEEGKAERQRLINERLALQVGALKGEWIRVADHLSVCRAMVEAVKPTLLSLPTTLAPEISPDDPDLVENLLTEAIDDCIRELGRIDLAAVGKLTKREAEAATPMAIDQGKFKK